MKKLLIIGHTYPEPTTTAAGTRMMQLISLFLEQGFSITFSTTAVISEKSEGLAQLNITIHPIILNDSSFDTFIQELSPSIVIFDRYITEEQFGWRVSEACPNAMRILDTEDLHFLRKAREEAIKKGMPVEEADLFSEIAKRELASIYRSDCSLIISEFEMDVLIKTFKIEESLLYYLPFLIADYSNEAIKKLKPFEERSDFMTVGNLLHAPNVDSLLYLKKEIWPSIRKQLPEAKIRVYGAYAPQQIMELQDKASGFLILGWADDIAAIMKSSRVCLAPIRFGAGLKGKLIDAMINGTPSVTTSIGAEGLHGKHPFSGIVADDVQGIVAASVELYSNKTTWLQAQQNGFNCIDKRFRRELFSETFNMQIQSLQKNLNQHRKEHFIGQILQLQSLKATKYMSKWIEEKKRKEL